jgi:hypothetical protein
VWLAGLALVLTGCATVPSNTPDDYGQVTEDNYLSACEEAGESSADCQCLYDGIVDTVPFNDFKDFEDRVKEDPTDVPGAYQDIVDGCSSTLPAGRSDADGAESDGEGEGDSTTTTRQPS